MLKITSRILRQRTSYFSTTIKEDYLDIGLKSKPLGKLTICPSPIGNLNDWSMRQDKALFEADVIACEDTRNTGMLIQLLQKKDIRLNLYGLYGENLTKEQKLNDIDDDDLKTQEIVFSSSKELAEKLPNLNEQFIKGEDISFFKKQKIEEMNQRIKKNQKLQVEKLAKLDPLNFEGQETDEASAQNSENFSAEFQDDLYGISAPFFTYLKNKITNTKDQKGRGILISCHKFNEHRRVDRLIGMLKLGFNVTLISDAGTPTISDPGYILVDKCIKAGVDITSIPGASAIPIALSLCGFPSDRFTFLGFPSKQITNREESLMEAKKQGYTVVLFESPLRINQLLLSIDKIYGENQMVFLGFELTKLFEKKLRGPCRQLFEDITNPKVVKQSHLKGEVTVVVAPFIEEYNESLRAKKIIDQEEEETIQEEEDTKEIEKMIKKVEVLPLAQTLVLNFPESHDKELSKALQEILRISKSRAFKIIKIVRHENQLEERKNKLRAQFGIVKSDQI